MSASCLQHYFAPMLNQQSLTHSEIVVVAAVVAVAADPLLATTGSRHQVLHSEYSYPRCPNNWSVGLRKIALNKVIIPNREGAAYLAFARTWHLEAREPLVYLLSLQILPVVGVASRPF